MASPDDDGAAAGCLAGLAAFFFGAAPLTDKEQRKLTRNAMRTNKNELNRTLRALTKQRQEKQAALTQRIRAGKDSDRALQIDAEAIVKIDRSITKVQASISRWDAMQAEALTTMANTNVSKNAKLVVKTLKDANRQHAAADVQRVPSNSAKKAKRHACTSRPWTMLSTTCLTTLTTRARRTCHRPLAIFSLN